MEDTMLTTIQRTVEDQVDVGDETSKFALGVGIVLAVVAGLWGAACIASALASGGVATVLQSYCNALIG